MKVLVAGSTGMIGTAACFSLRSQGHLVWPLIRAPQVPGPDQVAWNPDTGEMDWETAAGADAVINLSGASIADGRWTESRKELLRTSRIDATRKLVDALARLDPLPKVLVSASAVGYYGDRGDEILTEESPAGEGFLARLVQEWEAEARRAEDFGMRSVMLRFGVVLSAKGGALAQMLPPFRAGMGGRLGSGRQWMTWISLADSTGLIHAALTRENWNGAYNAVAPQPVTNAEFTRTLSRALNRPAIIPVPRLALRVLFGEMADEALLASDRVVPKRLVEQGYPYCHERLEPALSAALTTS